MDKFLISKQPKKYSKLDLIFPFYTVVFLVGARHLTLQLAGFSSSNYGAVREAILETKLLQFEQYLGFVDLFGPRVLLNSLWFGKLSLVFIWS